MALFGGKKDREKNKAAETVKPVRPGKPTAKKIAPNVSRVAPDVLVRPHVTEKAAHATAQNIYTFEVTKAATKGEIAAAVQAVYKVTPVKIGLAKVPASRIRLKTRRGFGTRSGMKKAYVYLKKGDRIEFSS